MGDAIYVSRAGYNKMVAERDELVSRKPKIAAAIKEALEKGDLKENAEYHAAKEELGHTQRRIAELENKMASARLLEDQKIATDKAYIGATVLVKDEEGIETKFTLVDSTESDPTQNRISVTSPIGQALLGKGPGESAKVTIGKGGFTLTVLKITRD